MEDGVASGTGLNVNPKKRRWNEEMHLLLHPRSHLVLVGLSVAGIGCTAEVVASDPVNLANKHAKSGAVIVGGLDWQEASSLPDDSAARANSRAVAYLSIPAEESRCTAFLIAPNVIMTNRHCIPQASAAVGATAYFRFESGAGGDVNFDDGVDCSTFVGNDEDLDYALLQCAGRPGDTFGVVGLSDAGPSRGASIYVVQQNCDWGTDENCTPTKKYAAGHITSTDVGDGDYAHDADTLGGSSGSPVFSSTSHEVVALHHVGIGGNAQGRGTENHAVPMTSILAALHAHYPGLELGARAPSTTPTPTTPTPPPTTTDGYEPNDTRAGATPVPSLPFTSDGAEIAGGGDVDDYAFNAGAASVVHVDFVHARGDLDLYVYDAAGTVIAKSDGVSDSEEAVIPSSAAGSVVVASVVGYRGATGSYTISLQ